MSEAAIIRGSEIELQAQRARNISYRKWARRISTDIDRREQQRIEDELDAADGEDSFEEHVAYESNSARYV